MLTRAERAASHALAFATSCSSPRFSLLEAPQDALLASASDLERCQCTFNQMQARMLACPMKILQQTLAELH